MKYVQALVASVCIFLVLAQSAMAEKKYDPGATDSTIKIGNIMPYSGPASSYGVMGKVEAAYFRKLNDEGGINGRKIEFISYDDAYSPPKAVEQARKLVESDEVLLIFSSTGTPSNAAIQKYMNAKQVPQLFVASYTEKWNDPKKFPWTMMGPGTTYYREGNIFAAYLVRERPQAKIAVLYQNDDAGKEALRGLKAGLRDNLAMLVAENFYEVSEPTIDSHIVTLKASGADTLMIFATNKFAAQAIRKVAEIGWKPIQFLPSVASSIGATLKPAGIENAQGIISATFLKDPSDSGWDEDPGMKRYREFMARYMPEGNLNDSVLSLGYLSAQALEQVLKQAGDDLRRENIMKQAANLKEIHSDILLPGITIGTSPDDFTSIKQMRLVRFEGTRWVLFDEIIKSDSRD